MTQEKDIYSRIDRFVIVTLTFIRKFPQDIVSREILKQLVRSCSSIGANAREGQTAQTKKEFVRCFSISKREAKETWYWLNILSNLNPEFSDKISRLDKEIDELIAIISKIIITSKKTIK